MRKLSGLFLFGLCLAAAPADAVTRTGYSGSKSVLELEGQIEGFLVSVQTTGGGRAPVGSRLGAQPSKSMGNTRTGDIALKVELPLAHGLAEWIRQMLDGSSPIKSGAVLSLDFNGKEAHRREFQDARIAQVTFPAVDASNKDRGTLLVKLSPEKTSDKNGSKQKVAAGVPKAQKAWRPSDFKLEIAGLEGATSHVSKIGPIVVTEKTVVSRSGGASARMGSHLGTSNLIVTFLGNQAQALNQWNQDASGAGIRGGSLTYLASDRQEALLRLEFAGLSLVNVTQDKAGDRGSGPSRVKAVFRFSGVKLVEGSPKG